jgi:hypothetical protein
MKFIKSAIRNILRILPQIILYLFIKIALFFKSRTDYKALKSNKPVIKDFKNAIFSFAYINRSKTFLFLNAYKDKKVKPVKPVKIFPGVNDPILVCAVKNELVKVKLQIEYHRKAGIKNFIYIDNMSDDGTDSWLKEQNDVSLYSVDENFHSCIKNAWRRQIADIYGYDRWYLFLDADELFMYPGIENKKIDQYVCYLYKKNIKCVYSPMIDMYSKNTLFKGSSDPLKIKEEYCYFDKDTYKTENELLRKVVTGGPRMRLFGESNTNSKYSLIYLKKEFLAGTHENHPNYLNFQTKGAIAYLLHYKFLFNDEAKFRQIAKDKQYGSAFMYDKYINFYDQNQQACFYYDGAVKLENSKDLLNISLTDKNFLKDFLVINNT